MQGILLGLGGGGNIGRARPKHLAHRGRWGCWVTTQVQGHFWEALPHLYKHTYLSVSRNSPCTCTDGGEEVAGPTQGEFNLHGRGEGVAGPTQETLHECGKKQSIKQTNANFLKQV